jgi:hypothetical protein
VIFIHQSHVLIQNERREGAFLVSNGKNISGGICSQTVREVESQAYESGIADEERFATLKLP